MATMINTLRPKGWVCPSVFQQTEKYQEFVYDGSDYTDVEILASGSDSELSPSHRAAKRRKIERLGTGFLKGQELIISSARPSATSIRQACQLLINDSSSPPDLAERVDPYNSSSAKWEDVDDDLEVMRKHGLRLRPGPMQQSRRSCETVRSYFKLKVGQRRPRLLTSGPSEEALAQAAMLHNKKATRSLSRISGKPAVLPAGRTSPEACSETGSAQSRSNLARDVSNEETGLNPINGCQDNNQDSDGDDSSHPRDKYNQSPLAKATANCSHNGLNIQMDSDVPSMPACENTNFHAPAADAPDGNEALPCPAGARSTKSFDASNYTTSEAREQELPEFENEMAEESPVGLLKTIHANPRKSWALMNEAAAEGHNEAKSMTAGTQEPPTSFELRHLVHSPAQTARNTKRRPTRATIKTSSNLPVQKMGRRTASSESPHVREAMKGRAVDQCGIFNTRIDQKPPYTASTQSGNTPFTYRKRSKVTNGEDLVQPDPNTPSTAHEQAARVPPVLDLSFGHDSSFARGLNKAFKEDSGFDRYLNRRIPRDPSSKKKILREMRRSGAEIIRTPSQLGHSPTRQAGDHSVKEPECALPGDITEYHKNGNKPQTQQLLPDSWEGTQNLLVKAQQGLFSSPHKQGTTHKKAPQPYSCQLLKKDMPHTVECEPLLQFSQEKTAVVQDDQSELITWSPWSAIKGHSVDQSGDMQGARRAVLGSKCIQDSNTSIAARITGEFENTDKAPIRRSGLRLSTGVTDPPTKQTALSFSIRKSQCSVDSQGSANKSLSQSFTSTAPDCVEEMLHATMQTPAPSIIMSKLSMPGQPLSFAAGPPLPSYEAAQISMDVTDLSANIDDLTRSALEITDMDGIMSQASIAT